MSEKCPLCEKSYKTIGPLRRHLTTIHNIPYINHSEYSEKIKINDEEQLKEKLLRKKKWIDFGIREANTIDNFNLSTNPIIRSFAYEEIGKEKAKKEIFQIIEKTLNLMKEKVDEEKRLWNITSNDIEKIRERFNIQWEHR